MTGGGGESRSVPDSAGRVRVHSGGGRLRSGWAAERTERTGGGAHEAMQGRARAAELGHSRTARRQRRGRVRRGSGRQCDVVCIRRAGAKSGPNKRKQNGREGTHQLARVNRKKQNKRSVSCLTK